MYQFLVESECLELTHLVFTKLGQEHLVGNVPVTFSNRMTRAMGYAYRGDSRRIQLSRPLFKLATQNQRMQTVIHEACHIVQFILYPHSKPHGKEWKSLMIKMGVPPKRCHNVDRTSIKTTRAKYTFKCSCRTFHLGATRYNRYKKGKKYFCNSCKAPLKLV